ncbi:dihydrofolate reductase family protein [Actinomadura viridis]|uniref:Dihydrofolate reductase n=1 Tax=Actinomadura viridis TaxID=58110 RepID=A0A931DQG9_9ACTN|nr:dihydrofolate reductase family protein [Actinomadura viridis]MBG6092142.1 dihydrofolate reductase [Actinomadura viridis]
MRKLVHFVHISLDGFIDGPNGEFDWTIMGGELSAYSLALVGEADAFLYGRPVWDMMSSYWPNAESMSDHEHDLAFAPLWRKTPKVVFSRTLQEADWNTSVIGGNLAEEVTALKEGPGGDMILMGGSALPGILAEADLIDEYHVVVHPVVLGGGKPLLGHPARRLGLDLVESRSFDGQTTLLRYRPKSA